MAVRSLNARYRSTTGLSTFERVSQRLPPSLPNISSLSSARIAELGDIILYLSEKEPRIFNYSPSKQLQFAQKYLIAKDQEHKQDSIKRLPFSLRIDPVYLWSKSESEFSPNAVNKLKARFISAPYHEAPIPKQFFTWFQGIVNGLKGLPEKFKIAYGENEHRFKISIKEWLGWLFADKGLSYHNAKKLQVLEHHSLSENLSLGVFNEHRVGLALHSLKAAGVIRDFILAKKYSGDDQLGIDAIAIIHEDNAGHTLSVPIQVKSQRQKRKIVPAYKFDFDTEASYLLSPKKMEYLFGKKKDLPIKSENKETLIGRLKNFMNNFIRKDVNSKMIQLDVERTIPMIKASGQSIRQLKQQIVEVIQKSFEKDKFLESFGNFRNKSFVHKLKLLLEQGFMKVKTPKTVAC